MNAEKLQARYDESLDAVRDTLAQATSDTTKLGLSRWEFYKSVSSFKDCSAVKKGGSEFSEKLEAELGKGVLVWRKYARIGAKYEMFKDCFDSLPLDMVILDKLVSLHGSKASLKSDIKKLFITKDMSRADLKKYVIYKDTGLEPEKQDKPEPKAKAKPTPEPEPEVSAEDLNDLAGGEKIAISMNLFKVLRGHFHPDKCEGADDDVKSKYNKVIRELNAANKYHKKYG